MEWSNYSILYFSKIANKYLLYSSLSNMIIELDDEQYKDILAIKENPNSINISDPRYSSLLKGRFIVKSNKTETNKIILSNLLQRFAKNRLLLTIAPTRACNFKCPYCYEKKNIDHIFMQQSTMDNIIRFVKSQNQVNALNIVWYGGEPTLAVSQISYLSKELQKSVKNYSAYMITNGYRLELIAKELFELKISGIQITLDGTQTTHDKTRVLNNGNGTFNKIIDNIECILKYNNNINIIIRMNISKNNEGQYEKLYQYIQTQFKNKVNLYPAFVHNYSSGCIANNCFESGKLKGEFLKKLFIEKGIYSSDLYPTRINKGCISQNINGYVIGPEGELYKCWHHLGIKDKVIGNLTNIAVVDNYDRLADYMIDDDSLYDSKCQSCVIFPSCYGGCTDLKRRGEDYCIPFKYMIEDYIDIRYMIKKQSVKYK